MSILDIITYVFLAIAIIATHFAAYFVGKTAAYNDMTRRYNDMARKYRNRQGGAA